jgi:hypothetical protein
MTADSSRLHTRRALLAGGIGGLAAVAASGLRPLPTVAGDGEAMVVGGEYTADSVTKITTTEDNGVAIEGQSPTGWGVVGRGDDSMFGGVYGRSTAGAGVVGEGGSGAGVSGNSDSGTGVIGASNTGVGIYAASDGMALQVVGKATFSRCGKATIAKGRSYVDIWVPGGLASNSVIHATLQTHRSGVAVAAVRKNYPVTGKARIYLTKVASTTSSTYVGWFAAEYWAPS